MAGLVYEDISYSTRVNYLLYYGNQYGSLVKGNNHTFVIDLKFGKPHKNLFKVSHVLNSS